MPLSQNLKQYAKAGALIILVAALALEATAFIQYYFAKKGIQEEANERAKSVMMGTKTQVMDIIDQAETAVRNSMWIGQWSLRYPDSLQIITERLVRNNPVIFGSSVSLVPGYLRRAKRFAPYSYMSGDSVIVTTLANAGYDYSEQEWFTKPLETGKSWWSEPYIDTAADTTLMMTYSVPLKDKKGVIAGVMTADIALDWLTEIVMSLKVYPHSFSMLVSRTGQVMVSSSDTLNQRSVQEMDVAMGDPVTFASLTSAMLNGEHGIMELTLNDDEPYQVYYTPMEKTGWSMAVFIPDDDIYGGIHKIATIVALLQLVGLGLLALILFFVGRNQAKFEEMSDKKDRMESELQIGRGIQMSMLPKTFPPFPERKDIDMTAAIVPAKEVGGDLYDFYIREEKLFFCIGDVSGKGVPASLVMAVTRSLFRTVSAHENSPAKIVTTINESMSDMNENNMFVTFFCGILDLISGELRYCNAGHNAPIILTDTIGDLPVEPNLPLGIMPGMVYKEQETILKYDDALMLYTDGITEAENHRHEQFGEERLKNVLKERRDAEGHLEAIKEEVRKFVGDAPQSDDITALLIHYLNDESSNLKERHLVLHNDIQQIPQLAEFVEKVADEAKIDQGLAMSINLALEEAVTNVIMYAYPEGSDGLVDVEAIIREKSLDFIVSDDGIAFDPTAAEEADITLGVEDRPIGGLGIFLVRKIMDSVTYERTNGKNILSMHKNI